MIDRKFVEEQLYGVRDDIKQIMSRLDKNQKHRKKTCENKETEEDIVSLQYSLRYAEGYARAFSILLNIIETEEFNNRKIV